MANLIDSVRRRIFWISCALLVVAIGCIAIPLGDPEKSAVDPKLVGIWMTKAENKGDQTMFTVMTYDARTYFVSEFDFSRNKDTVEAKNRTDWKMWLTDVSGQQFATLQMITPRMLLDPDDKNNDEKYGIAKLKLDGDKLSIWTIDEDFVNSANLQNSQQLQEFIAKNLDNPKLFKDGDAADLSRVKDDQKENAGAVLAAFGQGEGIK
jgi:hypothetical protein